MMEVFFFSFFFFSSMNRETRWRTEVDPTRTKGKGGSDAIYSSSSSSSGPPCAWVDRNEKRDHQSTTFLFIPVARGARYLHCRQPFHPHTAFCQLWLSLHRADVASRTRPSSALLALYQLGLCDKWGVSAFTSYQSLKLHGGETNRRQFLDFQT